MRVPRESAGNNAGIKTLFTRAGKPHYELHVPRDNGSLFFVNLLGSWAGREAGRQQNSVQFFSIQLLTIGRHRDCATKDRAEFDRHSSHGIHNDPPRSFYTLPPSRNPCSLENRCKRTRGKICGWKNNPVMFSLREGNKSFFTPNFQILILNWILREDCCHFFSRGKNFFSEREEKRLFGISKYLDSVKLNVARGIRKIRKIYKLVGNRGNSRKLTSTRRNLGHLKYEQSEKQRSLRKRIVYPSDYLSR